MIGPLKRIKPFKQRAAPVGSDHIKILPLYAQEIYQDAYNSARYKYRGLKTWFGNDVDPETAAHFIAWEAVKREYENRDGNWQKK